MGVRLASKGIKERKPPRRSGGPACSPAVPESEPETEKKKESSLRLKGKKDG